MAEQRWILHPIMARPSIPTLFWKGPLHKANTFDERQDTQTQGQTETIDTNRGNKDPPVIGFDGVGSTITSFSSPWPQGRHYPAPFPIQPRSST